MMYLEDDTEEHFAGFLSKAPDRNDDDDDDSQHPKSKKEAMAEVVTNSKIQKVNLFRLDNNNYYDKIVYIWAPRSLISTSDTEFFCCRICPIC